MTSYPSSSKTILHGFTLWICLKQYHAVPKHIYEIAKKYLQQHFEDNTTIECHLMRVAYKVSDCHLHHHKEQ
jgi:hypothetical protein